MLKLFGRQYHAQFLDSLFICKKATLHQGAPSCHSPHRRHCSAPSAPVYHPTDMDLWSACNRMVGTSYESGVCYNRNEIDVFRKWPSAVPHLTHFKIQYKLVWCLLHDSIMEIWQGILLNLHLSGMVGWTPSAFRDQDRTIFQKEWSWMVTI